MVKYGWLFIGIVMKVTLLQKRARETITETEAQVILNVRMVLLTTPCTF